MSFYGLLSSIPLTRKKNRNPNVWCDINKEEKEKEKEKKNNGMYCFFSDDKMYGVTLTRKK